MPWNPEIYNRFKAVRYQPFFDLMDLIKGDGLSHSVDVGCGTGEQTFLLSQQFKNSFFTGIDSSKEMLAASTQFVNDKLDFKLLTTEEFAASDSKWDLIFSNAALQWSDDHHSLFPKLIAKLNINGQFAVQIPFQKENTLNKILWEMVNEKVFSELLGGFKKHSPLLLVDDYATMMFECGLQELNISLKVYPLIVLNEIELYDFISGSALIPYMEKLDQPQQQFFKAEFIKRIRKQFQTFPAIYSFKRILLYGVKNILS